MAQQKKLLETGNGLGKFPLYSDVVNGKKLFPAETERSRLIQEHLQEIEELLDPEVPAFPAHGEEILSISPQEWEIRYRSELASLVAACREDEAATAVKSLGTLTANFKAPETPPSRAELVRSETK